MLPAPVAAFLRGIVSLMPGVGRGLFAVSGRLIAESRGPASRASEMILQKRYLSGIGIVGCQRCGWLSAATRSGWARRKFGAWRRVKWDGAAGGARAVTGCVMLWGAALPAYCTAAESAGPGRSPNDGRACPVLCTSYP